MSEPIQVGDLVVVVRDGSCECGSPAGRELGTIFLVGDIRNSRNRHCTECNRQKPNIVVAVPEVRRERNGYMLVYGLDRLKRIPPFPELADEKHDEEITA